MILRMRRFPLITLLIALAGFSSGAGGAERGSWRAELIEAVVEEHNLVRTDPAGYARYLEEWSRYYRGKRLKLPGRGPITTVEGVAGVEEAIRFLLTAEPVGPLTFSAGLSRAARDHVLDSGESGRMGHEGSDGSEPGDRANRYGTWYGRVGENIAYGGADAREFVIRLLIDDGVPDRGHRENIFNPDYTLVGVSFGYHREYQTMCVMTYAAEYEENSPSR